MDFDREASNYVAKLAEETARYDDMVEEMKIVAEEAVVLTPEERNLLLKAYQKAVVSRKVSWGILSKKLIEANETNTGRIIKYREKVEDEITKFCGEILDLLDEILIPSCNRDTDPFATVFYYKMKADFSRYFAQYLVGDDREEISDEALNAYEEASILAREKFPPTDPIRMGVALNYAKFYYENRKNIERACELVQEANREAYPELSGLNEEAYKDSTKVLQLLDDNHMIWKAEIEGLESFPDAEIASI